MKLISYPSDFSPLLADNFFHFEEADPSVSTEIYFFDEQGATMGARRYAGRSEIDSSPRALLQRSLDPEPVERGSLRVVQPAGRQVGLSVAVGSDGEHSSVVRFAANVLPLMPSSLVGASEQQRAMSEGDYDELTLRLTEGDRLTMECSPSGSEEVVCPLEFECPADGLYTLTFTARELLDILDLEVGSARVDVGLLVAGELKGLIHYRLLPACKGEKRVAWLDVYGAIRHYSFSLLPTERVEVTRRESDTLRGSRTLSVESWKSTTLQSGPLSRGELDYLQGIVCSPRVWMLSEGAWMPCSVENSLCSCGPKDVLSLEITLRPAQKTTLW